MIEVLSQVREYFSTSSELSPEALLAVLQALPLPLISFSLTDGKVLVLNKTFEKTFGYGQGDLQNWPDWSRCFTDASQRDASLRQWKRRIGDGLLHSRQAGRSSDDAVDQVELCVHNKGGEDRTVLHSGVVLPAVNCAIAIYVDITELKRNERRLEEAERASREREVLYPLLLSHMHEVVVISSADGTRRFVSPAVEPMTGWSPVEYLSRRAEDLVHPDDLARVQAVQKACYGGATGVTIRYRARKRDGTYLWMEALASCYVDPANNNPLGYIATLRDASEKHAEETQRAARTALLERQARFDHLTGVANRHVFDTALKDEARRQTRNTHALSLLLVDVDHFKLFNDRYGHLEGDRVLRQIAQLLQSSAHRVADLVARFGGEEFVLLLPMTEPEGAELIAQHALHAVSDADIPNEGSPLGRLTISIGIACWPSNKPLNRDQLLLDADRALYEAKNKGRNQVVRQSC